MAGIRVTIKRNALPQIVKQLPITADAIIMQRGEEMRQMAADLSRVDTGEMRDGWTWTRTSNASGVLDNLVPHTIFNEYGTIHMAAQPMARPAAEKIFPDIQDDFQHLADKLGI